MGQEKHYCMVQLWYFFHGLTITTTTKTVKMYLTLCKPTTISKKKKKTDVVLRNESLRAAELAEMLVYPRRVDTLFPATPLNQVTKPCHSE